MRTMPLSTLRRALWVWGFRVWGEAVGMERSQRVLELRVEGWKYREIADRVGCAE